MNIIENSKTLTRFLKQFAPIWVEDCVPVGTSFPYGTYTLSNEEFGGEGIIQVRFFSESTSLEEVATIVSNLERAIGEAGVLLRNGNGYLWVYKGSPFVQIEPTGEDNLRAMYVVLSYRNV